MRSISRLAVAICLAICLLRFPARGAEVGTRPVAVVDLHVDLPYQLGYEQRSFSEGMGQYPSRELLRAGVVGVVLPLFVPHDVAPGGPRLGDLESSYARVFYALTRVEPYALPGCRPAPGRVQTFLAFEGAAPLANRPELLASWVARGLRSVGLVHTRANALASSSGDPQPKSHGLTAAGRELVRAAHGLGVPIDVSHASDRAFEDILELSRADGVPTIATHSNARALADHPRNLTDAQIAAIGRSGGVVGVNFHVPFLSRSGKAGIRDVVRHIRHMVGLAGIDHVALGSDFEGDIRPAQGLEDVRGLPRLASALQASGLSRDGVQRIFSKNALRVLCREAPSARVGVGARPPRVYESTP